MSAPGTFGLPGNRAVRDLAPAGGSIGPIGLPGDRAASLGSRSRHPSARTAGTHLVAPLRRLVDALPGTEGPHWEVAFAVMAVRGGQARSREGFAAAYGISADEVGGLEAGTVPLADVPAPLRALTALDHLVAHLALLPDPH